MLSVLVNGIGIEPAYLVGSRIGAVMQITIARFNSLLSIRTGEPLRIDRKVTSTELESFTPEAGRIWWINREARYQMGRPIHQRYKLFVAAMYVPRLLLRWPSRSLTLVCSLKSRILYPVALVAATVTPLVADPGKYGNVPFDLAPLACLFSVCTLVFLRLRADYFHPDFSGTW